MWNITHHIYNARDRPRFDLIPYVGLGILHNESNGHHSFAFSYGVIGQYRLAKKIHLTMELGGTTTFKDFDGRGASRELGDHLLGLTAGITFDIGKAGWQRVIDAKPYIVQNQWLIDYANALREKNHSLSKQHSLDANVIVQMKKILEIEGLLGAYGDKLKSASYDEENDGYPRNDYSGLNSLRARLANRGWNGQSTTSNAIQHVDSPADSIPAGDYLSLMASGGKCIGSPIYFFFKIDTSDLTESSQLLNLDELARVSKAYHLRVTVTGAADSATGTVPINNSLSASRADYIYNELVKRGVDGSRINKVSEGGIDEYKPTEANRQTKVCLYYL
jgi:outer membrane protein OmpA-like peptidoglycan-associated protein